jgi:hypothetical protein
MTNLYLLGRGKNTEPHNQSQKSINSEYFLSTNLEIKGILGELTMKDVSEAYRTKTCSYKQ